MTSLVIASLAFIVIHFVPSSPLRPALVGKLGETAYSAIFSLVSAALLVWMILAYYDASPAGSAWAAGTGPRGLVALLMLPAFVLIIMGAGSPNPAMVKAGKVLDKSTAPTGIFTITRHPVMAGIALWAGLHLIVRADLPALAFFGGLLVTAVLGAWRQDARKRQELGPKWAEWAGNTSAIPFQAFVSGRTTIRFTGTDVGRFIVAAVLWAALLWSHGSLFGPPAMVH